MANRHHEYLRDDVALNAAIGRAATSTEPLWDLVIVASQLRNVVKCLEDVAMLAPHRPALERLVAEARGEIADRYLREELEKHLAPLDDA